MSYRARPGEFYKQFKEDPEAAKKAAFQLGVEMGEQFKRIYNIEGDDLNAVAALLDATMIEVKGEPTAKVEGNKVILRNSGFCVIMRASVTLGIPWEWLDTNFAWPWLEGIVSTIRPDIKMRVPQARNRGDPVCVHIFEIE